MNYLIPSEGEMKTIKEAAKAAVVSTLFRGKNEETAVAIALYARELGLPIMQCLLGGMHIINGVAELSVRMLNSLIRKSGHHLHCLKCDANVCILKGIRGDTKEECHVSFTIQEAEAAGLTGKDNWKKWTQDMLYARALSRLGRRLFPDVIGNTYVEGEVSGTDPKKENLHPADVEIEAEPSHPAEEKLTKEQATHIKTLLKDSPELLVKVLQEGRKIKIDDFQKVRYEGILKYIEEELKKGVA